MDAKADEPCEYHYVPGVSTGKMHKSDLFSDNTTLYGEAHGHMNMKKSAGKIMVGTEDTRMREALVSQKFGTRFKLMLTLAGAAHAAKYYEAREMTVLCMVACVLVRAYHSLEQDSKTEEMKGPVNWMSELLADIAGDHC